MQYLDIFRRNLVESEGRRIQDRYEDTKSTMFSATSGKYLKWKNRSLDIQSIDAQAYVLS